MSEAPLGLAGLTFALRRTPRELALRLRFRARGPGVLLPFDTLSHGTEGPYSDRPQ